MYKATKDFANDPAQSGTVSIRNNEFVVVVNKTNEYWWLVSNDRHETGYVPASCIAEISQQDKDNLVLKSINEAIDRIIKGKTTITKQEQALIRELESQKSKLQQQSSGAPSSSSSTKRRAPPPPVRKQEPAPVLPAAEEEEKQTKKDDAIEKVVVAEEAAKVVESHKVPETLGKELMETLKNTCSVSTSKSREGVVEILRLISVRVETSENLIQEILATLQVDDDEEDEEVIDLQVQLANLCEIKDDCQQRNWKIQNDDDVIVGVLTKIDLLLRSCNRKQCERVLKKDDHFALKTLVSYHQMETNTTLKILLLHVFAQITSFFPRLSSFLLTTVLPLELISEISDHVTDSERVGYTAILLSVLLAQSADDLTYQLQDALSEKFCCHLLDTIEDDETGDDVTATLIRLVLAVNLKYPDPTSNRVMTSLMKTTRTRLSEQLLLLLNREEDPVRVGDDDDSDVTGMTSQKADSIIKFLTDVFACKHDFLYTNDLMVLLDIITRNLNDLPPSARRTELLDLYLNIRSTEIEAIESRGEEIRKILQRIQLQEKEENGQNEIDQQIIQLILQQN